MDLPFRQAAPGAPRLCRYSDFWVSTLHEDKSNVIYPESMIMELLPVEVQRARILARKNNSPDYLGPASSVEALAPPGAEMNPVNDVQQRIVESGSSISDLTTSGNSSSLLFDSEYDMSYFDEPVSQFVSGTANAQCVIGQQELDINENWLNLYRKEFLKLVDWANSSQHKCRKRRARIARLACAMRRLDRDIIWSFSFLRKVLGSSRSIVKRASETSNGTTDFELNMVLLKIGCV